MKIVKYLYVIPAKFHCFMKSWQQREYCGSNNGTRIHNFDTNILHVSVTKVDGAVLELHKVKKSEAGSYLCIASNGHPPTVSRRVQLDIKCKSDCFIHHLQMI